MTKPVVCHKGKCKYKDEKEKKECKPDDIICEIESDLNKKPIDKRKQTLKEVEKND